MTDHDADATTAAASDADSRGPRLFQAGDLVAGRFRVVREIAEGGMGVVYQVIDQKLNERRAMKCAKPGYASHLPPEARHSLRVTHPNVCRVFEIHSTDTPAGPIDFLTMEFIDGGTLLNAIRAGRPLPEAEARTVAAQICAGVAAAHAQGVLHRDLKSGNVLLTKDQAGRTRAVVTDFGLAQEPSTAGRGPLFSGVAGTAAYLAPERLRGAPASVASDIYSLGVVLHEIVTGRLPESGPDHAKTLARELPHRWRAAIARCLEVDPRRRFPSATAVAAALSGRVARRNALIWTAVGAVPAAVLAWRVLFPTPLAARLAILPLELKDADAQTTAIMQGVSYDVSDQLRHVRPRPLQLVVIPIEETRGLPGGADQVQAARTRLGATYVLRGVVTQRGDVLAVHGAIVDTASAVALREWDQDYPASDAGAVAPAFTAMAAAAFRLPRQAGREHIAPAAYPAYATGLAALRRGGGGTAAIEATAALERAAALDPTALAPRAVLAEACAVAYDSTRDPAWLARGRDALAQAERMNPDAIAVHLAAGRLDEVAAAYDRAAQEYTRATELDANNADAWRGLARTYQAMHGHDADAANAFQTAIDVQPSYFAPLNDYADFQRLRGNYTQAEALWRGAAALAPDSLAAHANLGGLYSDMGRYADAERELQRALTIDARVRTVLNNLGSLYQYMGRDADAAVQFEQARKIGPESPALLLNLGDSYRRLRRTADAAAVYRQARVLADEQLLKNPRDAAIRSFVAYFGLRLGDRAAAERELTQALSLEPQNRTVIRRAAICYEAWGQRDRTLAVLQSAPPEVLKELGRQPDLTALRGDPRFLALLPASR